MQNNTENNTYTVLLFYKYVYIADPVALRDSQRVLCERLDLKGRIIVAHEGINATCEGTAENVALYRAELEKDPRFQNIHYKYSQGTGTAFPKLSVKARKEIVSLHLGEEDFDPNVTTGVHLAPEALRAWFEKGEEFTIVDMRNDYEHKVGKFEGSVCPPLANFRDLPKVMNKIEPLKNKKVLTVCTGGVRCEKASGYLIKQGFTDVYQLDGGIVSYMEKYPNMDFKGKLYVFDTRVTIGFDVTNPKHEIIGRCEQCGTSSEQYVNCTGATCHRHFIACENCQSAAGGSLLCPLGCTTAVEKNAPALV
ncbi:MAG: rhodanese-related sulfurtransferase [Candidatus Pacebacteria bacterium]|jgi:UPF0176 protein|nr:rhodanese-related sulfurtransferase [Candidatus Paceibacterota bacterium]